MSNTPPEVTDTKIIEAFEGLNQSYIEMESRSSPPPKCHLKHMSPVDDDCGELWRECGYCGHTKRRSGSAKIDN